MSFFDPLLTSNGKPYYRERFKEIIKEQVTLGYYSKGGVTYGDTEDMTPYERTIAYETIREILDAQNKANEEAIKSAQAQKNQSPRAGIDALR